MNNICTLIRRFIYIALGKFDTLLGNGLPLITVYCYHSISDDWYHAVSLNMFNKQMEYLSKTNEFISIETLEKYLDGEIEIKKPSVLITFDDGYKDVRKANRVLTKFNINAAVFLIGDSHMINRIEVQNTKKLLTKKDVGKMSKNNWSFGYHTKTHPDMHKLEKTDYDREIKNSMDLKYLALPKGKYNKNIISYVRNSKYKLCFTMDDGIISKQTDKFLIPRIGINQSHNLDEFKYISYRSNVIFRKFMKKLL